MHFRKQCGFFFYCIYGLQVVRYLSWGILLVLYALDGIIYVRKIKAYVLFVKGKMGFNDNW